MKDYITNWVYEIQHLSLKLNKLSKIYNQPWITIDDTNDFVKLIFQRNQKLIISKDGKVTDGYWELVSYSNSILLEINKEKRLYNNLFIDKGIMIFKLDGSSTNLFVLANQNIIPDLDISSYLYAKYSNQIKNVVEIDNPKYFYQFEKDNLIDSEEITGFSNKDLAIIEDVYLKNNSKLDNTLRKKIEDVTSIYLEVNDRLYISSIIKKLKTQFKN
ncbi:hypothetical protein [Tenacibaculum sp. A30]|uniref:hypothetical protein n=1 Tax=Tenacibaculum sp. A30 TaxID=3442644 RepID=UPI003EB72CE1